MIQSFSPIIDENSEILILGSIPGIPSLNKVEYYGNKNNAFWRILYTLFDQEFSNEYADKLKLLAENKIALWDTIQTCERKGSLDSAIKNVVANKIKDLCLKYPNINRIAFNGKSAEKYYQKYIGLIQGMEYLNLPSTSPANARMNFQAKLEKWTVLLNY